jgi:two-component system sensor histidine kinase PilS (NtrC family)
MLGQRVMVNEDLARRRGIALDNQIRISQRVVERMQDGVLIVAVDGLVSRCNPVASAMLGLSADAGVQLSSDAPALAEALRRWWTLAVRGLHFAVRMAGICRRALSEQQVQMAKCWFFWKMSGASRNVLSS